MMRLYYVAKCVASVLAMPLAIALSGEAARADRDRILELAWHQVYHLTVQGTPREFANFSAPLRGTGFVIKTKRSEPTRRYRIITAAHVVGHDNQWDRVGTGTSRSVVPYWRSNGRETTGALVGTPGVELHPNPSLDIAQVFVSGMKHEAATVVPAELTTAERYFVVSWGLIDGGSMPDSPYAREVAYKGLVPSSDGGQLALLEIVPQQDQRAFVPSESGSPVYDKEGRIVAIVVRERKQLGGQEANSALALPLKMVNDWIELVMKRPIEEPPPLAINLADQTASNVVSAKHTGNSVKLTDASVAILKGMSMEVKADRAAPIPEEWQAAVLVKASASSPLPVDPDPQSVAYGLKLLHGGCVLIGKYSARNLSPANNRITRDAPLGLNLLQRAIGLFPQEQPRDVTDDRASLAVVAPLESEANATPAGQLEVNTHCPTPIARPHRNNNWDRTALWSPLAGKVQGKTIVSFKSVFRQAYLGDFFYWGVIARIRQVD